MEKYAIDINKLDKEINAPKRIKLADVNARIEKVGFGMVRFIDDKNKLNLWQIVDGEYIVAMYEDQADYKTANDWSIESDKLNKNATIFYKNSPIKSIAFSEFGIPEAEINTFKEVLPERLANNKELVNKMMNDIDAGYKVALFNKYPELNK